MSDDRTLLRELQREGVPNSLLARVAQRLAEAPPPEQRVTDSPLLALETRRMREQCREKGIRVSWDGYVEPRAAAFLLGFDVDTLKKWRGQKGTGKGPAYRKGEGAKGRIEYEIGALAAYRLDRHAF